MGRPKRRKSAPRACPNCGAKVEGHPNKKYCSDKCRVAFWDTVDPKRVAFLKGRRSAPRSRVRSSNLSDMLERKLARGHGVEDDF